MSLDPQPIAGAVPIAGDGNLRHRLLEKLLGAVAGVIATLIVLSSLGIWKPTINVDLGRFDRSWFLWSIVVIFTVLSMMLVIWPIRKFREVGQQRRIEDINNFYPTPIIAAYLARFWSGRDGFDKVVDDYLTAATEEARNTAAQGLKQRFGLLVNEMFGLDRIRGATFYLMVVGSIVLFIAFEGGIMWGVETGPGKASQHFLLDIKPDPAAIAAIFGAYTWVASDVIYRYRQSDISSSDINWYALRFIVAIPLGMALAQFAGFKVGDPNSGVTNLGPILAFVISMFSLSRIQEVLGSLLNRGTGISLAQVTAADANDITVRLPGVDRTLSDRLASEGVTNIAQIAACDPVRLSSRANIPFEQMLNLIDAAILWQLVGPKLLKLREFGWTGASHVIDFCDRMGPDLRRDAFLRTYAEAYAARAAAQAILDAAAAALEVAQAAAAAGVAGADVGAATGHRDAALAALNGAAGALASAETAVAECPRADVFTQIGEQADMKPAAVEEAAAALSRNTYARFIWTVMRRERQA